MDATINLSESAVFVKVIEQGSFSRAAREMNVPTSTVSRSVQRLEESLGVRLIQRTTRKLTLTDVGAEFFRRVSPAIGAVKEAGDLVRGFSTEPCGTVRVTVPNDLGGVFGEALAGFHEAYPGVSVDLLVTNRRVDLVGVGVDFAFRAGKLDDSTLIAKRLGTTEFWAAAAPSYLAKHGTPKRMKDLEKHECVLFKAAGQRWSLVGPNGEAEVDVNGHIMADDLATIRSVVLAGVGIGLLPATALREPIADGTLVRVLPRYARPGAAIHLVYPSAQHLPAKLAVFRDFMVAEFARRFI
jgi:DNA-binding transcriptional LysR family regulator